MTELAQRSLAGVNSIFYGDKLLTTSNPQAELDGACPALSRQHRID